MRGWLRTVGTVLVALIAGWLAWRHWPILVEWFLLQVG